MLAIKRASIETEILFRYLLISQLVIVLMQPNTRRINLKSIVLIRLLLQY